LIPEEMAKVKRNIISLKCEECSNKNYTIFKTKNIKEKIEQKKYCDTCKKHTAHKETKVK
jgi:large subunit ribosomal protein L33